MIASVGAETAVSASDIALPRPERSCVDCGAPRSKASRHRCRACCYTPRKREMPTDFVEVAPTLSATQLAAHYQTSTYKITEWFRACNMLRTNQTRFSAVAAPPSNFEQFARIYTLRDLMNATGRGEVVVKRWLAELGITPRRAVATFVSRGNRMPPPPVVHRDLSRAGGAAAFLQRYGPVYRCHPGGAPAKSGTHWSRGGYVLTDAELIERAERLGYDSDAWRKVA